MDLIEVRRLCRVCSKQSQSMTSLFEKKGGLILADMLSSYTKQTIEQSDLMPSNICLSCLNRLSTAHAFFTLARTNQMKFQVTTDTTQLPQEIGKHADLDTEMVENPNISSIKANASASTSKSTNIEKRNSPASIPLSLTAQAKPVAAGPSTQLPDPLGSNEVCELMSPAGQLQLVAREQPAQQQANPVPSTSNIIPAKINKKRVENVRLISILECYLCKMNFETIKECKAHLAKHIETMCEVCYVHFTVDRLNKHLCLGESVQCEYCEEILQSTISFLEHLKCHKDQHKLRRCACSKEFASIFLLNAHKQWHITERLLKPFSCDVCDKRFKEHRYLADHKRITHSTEKQHLCTECGRTFKVAMKLKLHALRHSNYKPIACTKCPSRFYERHELPKHMRKKHCDGNYDECRAERSSRRALDASGSDDRDVHRNSEAQFCDLCTLSFKTSQELYMHRRTHSGERIFGCEKCGQKFKCSQDRRNHMRAHKDYDKGVQCRHKPSATEMTQNTPNE